MLFFLLPFFLLFFFFSPGLSFYINFFFFFFFFRLLLPLSLFAFFLFCFFNHQQVKSLFTLFFWLGEMVKEIERAGRDSGVEMAMMMMLHGIEKRMITCQVERSSEGHGRELALSRSSRQTRGLAVLWLQLQSHHLTSAPLRREWRIH